MMLHSKQQVATVQEVRRQASRYILWKLGDRLWAGEPTYNERRKRWTVPIHSRSLPADIELGQITLDAHGTVVRAPSRRALGRRIEEIDAILELEGRKPRTRDDSRVRALALATKARREMKLPAKAIDWQKLFATVTAEYAQGRTEGEINWEQVVADCKLEKKAPQAVLKWAYGLAAVIVLGLFVFAWNPNARYRALNKQFEALTASVDVLKQQNTSLQQENATLRKQVEEAAASHEQTQQRLTTQQTTLGQRVAQLQQENETLKKQIKPSTVLVTLQDTEGLVTFKGTVRLGQGTLPPSLSQTVFDFVTRGEVTPAEPVRVAMEKLGGDTTRGELQSTRNAEKPAPVPLSPVLTAIRSTTPTLRWTAVPGAQAYQVIVLDSADNLVWDGSAGTQTQVPVLKNLLQQGQVYHWQVEALVEGQSRLSPIVRFWVIDERTLREVEAAGGDYPNSAVVLASVYQAYGLYEDALAQLERLTEMNPDDPFAKRMLNQLHHQLGKEEQ